MLLMKVIEKFIKGKYDSIDRCEDAYYLDDNFACVIDGATNKSDKTIDGKTSGQMAVRLILDSFMKISPIVTPSDLFDILTNNIYNYYQRNNLLERMKSEPVERFTASIVVYSKFYNQIWSLGDCQFMVNDEVYKNDNNSDHILSKVRSIYLLYELDKNKTDIHLLQHCDSGREFILPILKRMTFFQNNPNYKYSYAVLDGFQPDFNDIIIKEVKSNEIILASDGYPILFDSLAKSESALENILKEDPLLINKFCSTKGLYENQISYDDRTYLRIGVGL